MNMSDETIRRMLGIRSSKAQALRAVQSALDSLRGMGVNRCYETIFETRRGQGNTTNERIALLASCEWKETSPGCYLLTSNKHSPGRIRLAIKNLLHTADTLCNERTVDLRVEETA